MTECTAYKGPTAQIDGSSFNHRIRTGNKGSQSLSLDDAQRALITGLIHRADTVRHRSLCAFIRPCNCFGRDQFPIALRFDFADGNGRLYVSYAPLNNRRHPSRTYAVSTHYLYV